VTGSESGDNVRRQQLRIEALKLGGPSLVAQVNAVSLEMAEKIIALARRSAKGYAQRITPTTLSTLANMRDRLKARKGRQGQ